MEKEMNKQYNYKMSKSDFGLLIACELHIEEDKDKHIQVSSISINELDEIEVEYKITN